MSHPQINYGRVPISLVQQTCQLSITSSLCSLTPTLAVPTGNDVSLFELFTGKKVAILRGHYGKVTSCILHPFEQVCMCIVWAGEEGNVVPGRVWEGGECPLYKMVLRSEIIGGVWHVTMVPIAGTLQWRK